MVGATRDRLEAGEGKGGRAAATEEHAGAPAEETETLGLETVTGEEASLGASGSSGEE